MAVIIENEAVKKTYRQDWKAYNAAQTGEKEQFLNLLHTLCSTIDDLPQKNGRPRLPLKDALFSVCYKIYSTVSGRRFMSDLRDAQEKGLIEKTPHFNSIFNYLEDEGITPILYDLITTTSLPLVSVEEDFAADSSGFTASRYARWIDHKYGKQQQKEWVKVHIMCGTKTNVVTAVQISGKYAADSPMMPELVRITAENFAMREVSADKAYGGLKNYDAISDVGAIPYIPFKEYQKAKEPRNQWSPKPNSNASKHSLWKKMYYMFKFNEEEFKQHYHKRSNVETTFSMIKAKFGGNVRSKTDTAMVNECLCKIICHNICVLIQEMHELGIDVNFLAQKVPSA